MKCTELQSELSLYTDRFFADDERVAVEGHLKVCPLCRQKHIDFREIQSGLRLMPRPEVPAAVSKSLKRAVADEIRLTKTSAIPISREMREWLHIRMMPYGVGVIATLVVGFTFLSLMFSGISNSGPLYASMRNNPRSESPVLLASNTNPFQDPDSLELTAPAYAFSRADVSSESPSINPRGALIALTKSLVRGGMKDDEVVVVADVFGNGLARIAEVVEPSRDRRAVAELRKALDSDPAYAPFVSASLDNRSDSVRVVLKFQSVDVSTSQKRRHR